MEYSKSIPFTGDVHQALDTATNVLLANGFAIRCKQAGSVELLGPGMFSNRQNPIVGASSIRLTGTGKLLSIDAELGGVRRMCRFLKVFPLAMALGFAILLGLVAGLVFGQVFNVGFGVPQARGWHWIATAIPIAVLPLSPWLLLSPMMAWTIRSRTFRALDTLLSNMAAAGMPSVPNVSQFK